jgi:hypothetical protein
LPDYLGYNEKTIMNAIIHQGWHPFYKGIRKVCDKCKSEDFIVVMEKELPKSDEWDKLEILILHCPHCGNKELDIDGVYFLPEFLPNEVLPWIGSFIALFCYLYSKMDMIYPKKKVPE